MAAIRDQLDHFTQGRIEGGGGDLRSGDHDGMGLGLLQVEDPMDHVRLFVGEQAPGLTLIHEIMDFLGKGITLMEVRFLFADERLDPTEQAVIGIIFQRNLGPLIFEIICPIGET